MRPRAEASLSPVASWRPRATEREMVAFEIPSASPRAVGIALASFSGPSSDRIQHAVHPGRQRDQGSSLPKRGERNNPFDATGAPFTLTATKPEQADCWGIDAATAPRQRSARAFDGDRSP